MILKSALPITKRGHRYDPLDEEHTLTVAIDFDGTIAEYHAHHRLEETVPRPGAREALEQLWDAGYRLIIWTARDDDEEVQDWLDEYRIPYDEFNNNPEQPTDSRKITADVYLDDRGLDARGDWTAILAQTQQRLREHPGGRRLRRQHIILTGPSGVGKSYTSRLLSEVTGMPIWKLDDDDEWMSSDDIADHPDRYTPGTKAYRKYRKLLKRLVRRALKRKTPSILEGCQFLVAPGTLRGHQIVLIDADEETVVCQRLQRDEAEGKLEKHTRQQRIDKARFLYRALRPAIERLKALPGVETITPAKAVEWVQAFARRPRKSYNSNQRWCDENLVVTDGVTVTRTLSAPHSDGEAGPVTELTAAPRVSSHKNDFAGILPGGQPGSPQGLQGSLRSRLADRSGEGLGDKITPRLPDDLRAADWAEGRHLRPKNCLCKATQPSHDRAHLDSALARYLVHTGRPLSMTDSPPGLEGLENAPTATREDQEV